MNKAIEKCKQKIKFLSSDEKAMGIFYERANMISSAEHRGKIEFVNLFT